MREHGRENLDIARQEHGGFIFSVWHQNLIAAAFGQKAGKLVLLGSKSRTADPIVRFTETLGHEVVRGSSAGGNRDKGGKAAKQAMIIKLAEHKQGAVTPDGPRGPAFKAKPGIVAMASETGLAIVPLCVKATRYWQFKSWDKIQMPKPFATLDVYYGPPIAVAADLSEEQRAALLDQVAEATNALTPASHAD